MAVIEYKCTVCKRQIEVLENTEGLEVIQRCIITEGCRGELYRVKRKQGMDRGSLPPRVPGLLDYTPRRALFNYTQSVQSREWFITHNMGVAPSVQVLIDKPFESTSTIEDIPCVFRGVSDAYEQVETTDFEIEILNANQIVIRFTDPQSGSAQLLARSTAFEVTEPATDAQVETFQMTSTGSLLSIATLNDVIPEPNDITIEITYRSPDALTTVVQTYNIGTSANVDSPWDDYTTILIQGKRYKVRTFDVFIPEMADGTLPDGSSFYFSALDIQASGSPPPRDIEPREVFVLLGLNPYENVDKVKDEIIDTNNITIINAELSLFIADREMYAFDTVIDSTFPPIREVS